MFASQAYGPGSIPEFRITLDYIFFEFRIFSIDCYHIPVLVNLKIL